MKTLFKLERVTKSYNGKTVLNVEDLEVPEDSTIGLFGPNGSGKTTLFKLLALIEAPSSGSILYKGIDTKGINLDMRRQIAFLPQEPYLLKRSVFENIILGLKFRNIKKDLKERAIEALSWVGLPGSFLKRRWNELSGGEAQRIALASRLVLRPKVLILDEPTANVDIDSVETIKEAILLARRRWKSTILISSHDREFLDQVTDVFFEIYKGKIVN